MALYGADYEVFCESIKRRVGEREEIYRTISIGPMPTSRAWDFSQWLKPMRKRANPDEETIDWSAVYERTACTARKEGESGKGSSLTLSQRDVKLYKAPRPNNAAAVWTSYRPWHWIPASMQV